MVTPAAGLSLFAMPIFLAMTAWGVLGKFENVPFYVEVANKTQLAKTKNGSCQARPSKREHSPPALS
jgi:hypothetical protein